MTMASMKKQRRAPNTRGEAHLGVQSAATLSVASSYGTQSARGDGRQLPAGEALGISQSPVEEERLGQTDRISTGVEILLLHLYSATVTLYQKETEEELGPGRGWYLPGDEYAEEALMLKVAHERGALTQKVWGKRDVSGFLAQGRRKDAGLGRRGAGGW